jgi:hypothetical protein
MTSFPQSESVHQKMGSKACAGRNKQQKPIISEALSIAAIHAIVAATNAISTLESALTTIAATDLAITQIKEKLAAHTIDMKAWMVVEDAAITAVRAVTEAWDKTWTVFQSIQQIAAGLMKVIRARVAAGFMVEDVTTQVEFVVIVQFEVEDAAKAWVEIVKATENMMLVIKAAVYKWKVREAVMGDIFAAAAVEAEVISAMEYASRYASTAKDKAASANIKTLAVVKDKILHADCVIKKLVYTNHEEKQ